jgi:poly-gamma-glutamate biosynthesis protein PgsC/CapC
MGSATLFLGLLLSTAMVELTGIYPGGIIVPGYMALFLDQPVRIAATLFAAILTYGSYRLLARRLLLFGRRRFVILILLGAAWALLIQLALPPLAGSAFTWQAIGWIIPGLIANTFARQNVLATLLSLSVVTAGTYLLMQWLGSAIG